MGRWWLAWLVCCVAVAVGLSFAWRSFYRIETTRVALSSPIKNAIVMKELDYKFAVGKGWGGAGGQGAAILFAQSPEQFLAEVAPEEKIYTVLQVLREDGSPVVKKLYVAGIENRPVLLGYEQTAAGKHSDWTINSFTSEEVVFQYPRNVNGLVSPTIIIGLVLVVWFFALVVKADEHRRGLD